MKRVEPIMTPDINNGFEMSRPKHDSAGNVIFTCGSYELNGHIYIIYGGADTFTMAARIRKQELLDALENSDNQNPYI